MALLAPLIVVLPQLMFIPSAEFEALNRAKAPATRCEASPKVAVAELFLTVMLNRFPREPKFPTFLVHRNVRSLSGAIISPSAALPPVAVD